MAGILQMAYHPAKKEVQFKRFNKDGQEVEIREGSRLTSYMVQRGKFVLQHYGEQFFDDIVYVFDGQRAIDMRVITTEPDFLDFQQMVEHYNKTNKEHIRIHATPGAAFSNVDGYLPDMNQVYENVRDYGLKATEILNELRGTFSDIPQDKEAIRESIANFDGDIQREIERIKEKVDSLGNNNVNLCFAGVYSTGKSALINALLGYRILPESSDSETARMFQIRSPKGPEEPISVTCKVGEDTLRLKWSESKFTLDDGPTENDTRRRIQCLLNEFNESSQQPAQHEQMCKLLKLLNGEDDVGTEIEIAFPIPMDTANVQFTIFDTPGTDSNYEAHQQTLIEALDEQANSILIFVAAPDKMEGTGNQALFQFINQAKADGSATIDISRSLFVINKADTVEPKDRESKQNAQIMNKAKRNDSPDEDDIADEDVDDSISLSDKKLFFVSAKVAYAAKAEKMGISTAGDSDTFDTAISKQQSQKAGIPEMHRYYKQNKCANSDFATNHMISQCDEALAEAIAADNQYEIVHISSGLYALEKEIVQYGEKYAAAVRAYAMIEGVDKALTALRIKASSLKVENEETLCRINQNIEQIRSTIAQSIKEALDGHTLPKGVVPDEQSEYLKLDEKTYKGVQKRVKKAVKGGLNQLFPPWYDEKKKDEKKKALIKKDIDRILSDWTAGYVEGRHALLTRVREDAITDARAAIEKNGKVYPGAVQYVCNIQPPKLEEKSVSVSRLYDISQDQWKFLWMKGTFVDAKKFVSAVMEELSRYWVTQGKDYREDYRKSLSALLGAIQSEFEKNLHNYSLLMRAMMENRQSVEALHDEIAAAAEKLAELQRGLNDVIWRVQTDG